MRDTYREHGWWRDETFLDDLRKFAEESPDRVALIAHRDGGERVISYAELASSTESFAGKLAKLGVGPGDIVAVQIPNWWELLPLGLACARLGAIFCPLLVVYRQRDLEFVLRLAEPKVVITMSEWDGLKLGEIVTELAGQLPRRPQVLVADGQGPAGTLSFEYYFYDSPEPEPGPPAGTELGPDDPFLMLFTSGTTGESKGVLHSQNTLFASARAYADVLGLGADTVTFISHVANHYSGYVTGLLTTLMCGGATLLISDWDPRIFVDIAPRYGVTTFYGAPSYLVPLLTAYEEKPSDLSSLRFVISGSAPIPPSVLERVKATFDVRVVALWGMTENGATTITRLDDPPDWAMHSDGSALGGMEIRLDTSAVPGSEDGSGLFLVRGPSQCLGYFKREELYASCLDADGWFSTGDLARPDGRGGIRITGRVKDVVIANGFNVPVTEVESALLRHPQVRDAAIIGVRTDSDEIVCAVVVPRDEPPSLQSLLDHLVGEGFSELYVPGRLELVSELPRTITGKVRKVELRAQYAGT
jgi:cyclohexanecarboxylate-CoA ligase